MQIGRPSGGAGRDWRAAAVVVGVALLAVAPVAWLGYPPNADDVHYHVIYAEQFLRQVLGGEWYPRWLLGMNDGLGAPIFFFYGPVPYVLTSLCGLLTGERQGFGLLALALFVMLPGSGLAAFAWLRRLVPRWPAAIGAALYVAMPYHLTIDLWTRSAFAEFTAYAWTPLLFLAVEWIRAGRCAGLLLFVPALALLIATHIITAMLVSLALGAYALARLRAPMHFVWLAVGFAWGTAVSAVYLMPALGLRAAVFIPVGTLPRAVFMLAGAVPHDRQGLWHVLDALVLAELTAACLMLGCIPLLPRTGRGVAAIWGALGLVALLGTTWIAMPVWNALPPLQNAQYPFRLNTVADLSLATLAALLAAGLASRVRQPARAATLILLAIAASGAAQITVPLLRSGFDPAHATGISAYPRRYDSSMFRPIASLRRLPLDADPVAGVTQPAAQVIAGQAVVTPEAIRPRRLTFQVQAATAATVIVRQLYFPGWQAEAGGTVLATHPSADLGLVEADLPPGRYTLQIVLQRGRLERAGRLLSAIAAAAWLALLVAWRWPRGRRAALSP